MQMNGKRPNVRKIELELPLRIRLEGGAERDFHKDDAFLQEPPTSIIGAEIFVGSWRERRGRESFLDWNWLWSAQAFRTGIL